MLIFSIVIGTILLLIGLLKSSSNNSSSNETSKEKCPKCGSNSYKVINGYNIEHNCDNCGYTHTIWG